jgi:transcriptional regulator with PAS, ATPase and Fis domain
MRALFHQLARAAVTEAAVLLRGESGTGKEVLGHAIHAASARAGGPFVVLDCSALAAPVLEAELFGYEKGAFTGAAAARTGLLENAHGGTLFLDEVGELPLEAQSRLLRALETREVRPLGSGVSRPADARVVAATHRDLRAQCQRGTFRKDLFFRLAVVELEIPALRERKEDIPLLVAHMLGEMTPRRTLADLPPHALQLLEAHDWPGNVRELRNTVVRLLLFPELGLAKHGSKAEVLPWREAREQAIGAFESTYLRERLRENQGNVTATAKAMGVSRQFLHELLARHRLGGGGPGA